MSAVSVQAALSSIGVPRDLRLRTTLRRDDVNVLTDWMPTYATYETLVQAPATLMDLLGWEHEITVYATRDEAIAKHEVMVTRVQAVLADLKALQS
jgi:hypothetical protein